MRSTVEIEKAGIPTVALTTTEFVSLAKAAAQANGMGDLPFVVVPHPVGGLKEAEVRAKIDPVIDEIIYAATQYKGQKASADQSAEYYPAPRITVTGTVEDVNELLYRNGWTDGLPIIPPTEERVQYLLTGTDRSPSDIIGIVPPRMGVATVETVAAVAAMAGCEPAYMPVIIAALEAMLDPAHNWQALTTTTNPTAPLVVVNGPIVKQLGIGYGQGCLAGGPGLKANVAIGRAINLIGDIIGGSKPPDPDKSTHGQTANVIAMVFGENEDANPWQQPLSVDRGFARDANTVSVFPAEIPTNINDHESESAADFLKIVANTMAVMGNNNAYIWDTDVMLILSPEHAAMIAKDGWTKDDVRRYLYEFARIPYYVGERKYKTWYNVEGRIPRWAVPPSADSLMPIINNWKDIQIVVAGGSGKHSIYVSSFAAKSRMVTKEIRLPANWNDLVKTLKP